MKKRIRETRWTVNLYETSITGVIDRPTGCTFISLLDYAVPSLHCIKCTTLPSPLPVLPPRFINLIPLPLLPSLADILPRAGFNAVLQFQPHFCTSLSPRVNSDNASRPYQAPVLIGERLFFQASQAFSQEPARCTAPL